MKKFLSFIILLLLCNTITTFAQNFNFGEFEKQQNEYIHEPLRQFFDDYGLEEIGNLSLEDLNNWMKCFGKVRKNFSNLLNKEKVNNTDIDDWNRFNKKIYETIKDGKIAGITARQAKDWNDKCNKFIEYYKRLVRDNSKGNNTTNKEDGSNNTTGRGYTTQKSKNQSQQAFTYENPQIKEALEESFKVCLFLPLAVKFNNEYVDYAYNTLNKMFTNKLFDYNSDQYKDWRKFGHLLKDYYSYNQDVIEYISTIGKKVNQKGGKINRNDITFYKNSMIYDMDKYSVYYKQEVSIKHLDNVLDEFFSMLEGYADEGRDIPDRVFTNFILNNLDSEYNPN